MKKIFYIMLSALLLGTYAQGTGHTKGNRQASGKETAKEQTRSFNPLNKINIVAAALSRLYVDKLNMDTIAEKTIAAMLRQLDPHSTYLPPNEARQTLETLSGKIRRHRHSDKHAQRHAVRRTDRCRRPVGEGRPPARRPHRRHRRHDSSRCKTGPSTTSSPCCGANAAAW